MNKLTVPDEHPAWRVLMVEDDSDDYLITRDLFTEIGQGGITLEWVSTYQAGLATYLDRGGRVLIESTELIAGENAPGLLNGDWTSRYLGSNSLIRSPQAGRSDST